MLDSSKIARARYFVDLDTPARAKQLCRHKARSVQPRNRSPHWHSCTSAHLSGLSATAPASLNLKALHSYPEIPKSAWEGLMVPRGCSSSEVRVALPPISTTTASILFLTQSLFSCGSNTHGRLGVDKWYASKWAYNTGVINRLQLK